MHICCSGCALHPLSSLLRAGARVRGLWYNPNIHPEEEYDLRLGSLRRLQQMWGLSIEYHGAFGLDEFNSAIESSGVGFGHGERCKVCYEMRLDYTAAVAAKLGIGAFSTTLLVSPWQKHDLIAEAGQRAAEAHGVEFHYRDFRPGWREGRTMLQGMDLYRQNYCGCIYSKAERLAEKSAQREAAQAAVRN